EEAHDLAPLDAEALRHHDHQRMTALRAHHREPDAGVATRRFDHGLPGFEHARARRRVDHAKCEAILDAAEWITRFELGIQLDAGGRELVDAHDGRLADRLRDVVVAHEARAYCYSRSIRSGSWAGFAQSGAHGPNTVARTCT